MFEIHFPSTLLVAFLFIVSKDMMEKRDIVSPFDHPILKGGAGSENLVLKETYHPALPEGNGNG